MSISDSIHCPCSKKLEKMLVIYNMDSAEVGVEKFQEAISSQQLGLHLISLRMMHQRHLSHQPPYSGQLHLVY